jgi:hypothetical protein
MPIAAPAAANPPDAATNAPRRNTLAERAILTPLRRAVERDRRAKGGVFRLGKLGLKHLDQIPRTRVNPLPRLFDMLEAMAPRGDLSTRPRAGASHVDR